MFGVWLCNHWMIIHICFKSADILSLVRSGLKLDSKCLVGSGHFFCSGFHLVKREKYTEIYLNNNENLIASIFKLHSCNLSTTLCLFGTSLLLFLNNFRKYRSYLVPSLKNLENNIIYKFKNFHRYDSYSRYLFVLQMIAIFIFTRNVWMHCRYTALVSRQLGEVTQFR